MSLTNRIKTLEKENLFLKEKYNESILEFKRKQRILNNEKKKIEQYCCFEFIKNIIPLVDCLEITYRNAIDIKTKKGILITLKILKNNLKKQKIKKINPKKYEVFNPSLHQAIVKIKKPNKPNLIYNVLQKGYVMNKKVLRPALVSVTSEF
ncbi:nucleotide exchange factor GrpE [Candidatus Vidania fulgoroideorum]